MALTGIRKPPTYSTIMSTSSTPADTSSTEVAITSTSTVITTSTDNELLSMDYVDESDFSSNLQTATPLKCPACPTCPPSKPCKPCKPHSFCTCSPCKNRIIICPPYKPNPAPIPDVDKLCQEVVRVSRVQGYRDCQQSVAEIQGKVSLQPCPPCAPGTATTPTYFEPCPEAATCEPCPEAINPVISEVHEIPVVNGLYTNGSVDDDWSSVSNLTIRSVSTATNASQHAIATPSSHRVQCDERAVYGIIGIGSALIIALILVIIIGWRYKRIRQDFLDLKFKIKRLDNGEYQHLLEYTDQDQEDGFTRSDSVKTTVSNVSSIIKKGKIITFNYHSLF